METLESVKEEKDIVATLSLLTMVIKSVPQPVLREKYKDSGETFHKLLEHFTEHENPNALRSVSVLHANTWIVVYSQTTHFIRAFFSHIRLLGVYQSYCVLKSIQLGQSS